MQRWDAIFRRVGLREVLLMFGFAILNIIVSMSIGALLQTFGTVTANAGIAGAADLEGARLVLTWGYVSTRNIWVSTGAHIINDWTLIGMTVFVAPLAAAA